ncbi:MAG: hypothetical protein JJ952_17400 [Pseudomonadales bacterium]|nr:hypothetical protein [Pseudomonadales bacterium]MBO6824332.1 hypothetical protein [Pseudomonadales bacterium]
MADVRKVESDDRIDPLAVSGTTTGYKESSLKEISETLSVDLTVGYKPPSTVGGKSIQLQIGYSRAWREQNEIQTWGTDSSTVVFNLPEGETFACYQFSTLHRWENAEGQPISPPADFRDIEVIDCTAR